MPRKAQKLQPTTRVLVTEIDQKTLDHTRYIWFDLPFVCDPGGYIATGSFSAFFHGAQHYKKRNHSPRFLYTVAWGEDLDFRLRYDWRYHIHTPNVVVKTLWDFYKLIGYDHKKNRYDQ